MEITIHGPREEIPSRRLKRLKAVMRYMFFLPQNPKHRTPKVQIWKKGETRRNSQAKGPCPAFLWKVPHRNTDGVNPDSKSSTLSEAKGFETGRRIISQVKLQRRTIILV